MARSKIDILRELQIASKYGPSDLDDSDWHTQVRVLEKSLRQYAGECFDRLEKDSTQRLGFVQGVEGMKLMNESLDLREFKEPHIERCRWRFDTHDDKKLSRAEFQKLYRTLFFMQLHECQPGPISIGLFAGRRSGSPSDHYVLSARQQGRVHNSAGFEQLAVCKESGKGCIMRVVEKEAICNSGMPLEIVSDDIDRLKALDHPAVLRLHEYFAGEHCISLLTEAPKGTDLLQLVTEAHTRRRLPSERWVRQMFVQVCEGIAYIHTKGVTHQDLRLESIILCTTSPPEPLVVDSGMAELFPAHQAVDGRLATPPLECLATMAPEVMQGRCTHKSDVWSLGCCLFALLCCRPFGSRRAAARGGGAATEVSFYPFEAPTELTPEELESFRQQQQQGPELGCLRELEPPSNAKELLRTMLHYGEDRRHSMTKVLAHVWLQQIGEPSATASRWRSFPSEPRTVRSPTMPASTHATAIFEDSKDRSPTPARRASERAMQGDRLQLRRAF